MVEGKNAATVRKHLGYVHIPQRHAARVNAFNREHLVPYLNFHRPCFFPQTVIDAKGKPRKRYRYPDMMTPYEKLKSLPQAHTHLKPGITFEQLDAKAQELSDNEAAAQLQRAKQQLFQQIHEQTGGLTWLHPPYFRLILGLENTIVVRANPIPGASRTITLRSWAMLLVHSAMKRKTHGCRKPWRVCVTRCNRHSL